MASEETSNNQASTSENFVVLDMAGDSEDSDKDIKVEKTPKASTSDADSQKVAPTNASTTKAASSTNPRLRKKPKAPVVDVNSLRSMIPFFCL